MTEEFTSPDGWEESRENWMPPPDEEWMSSPEGEKVKDLLADPVDFLNDEAHGTPELKPHHVPDVIYRFSRDTAERMGSDPCAVALSALVCCSSVVSDDWAIQPKEFDYTWTENARLWGAIVGAPSIRKTPIIYACSKPIDRLEVAARKDHAEAMQLWRTEAAVAKKEKIEPPPKPLMARYMVESATIEALQEVLRVDEQSRFFTPCKKILCRQDEISELIGSFDRYRSGGKGGSDRGAYLRLYNGTRFTSDRVGRGAFACPHWSGTILGGIQPEVIRRIAGETDDDGLLQRFLYCVPAKQEKGDDRRPDPTAVNEYERLFPALVHTKPSMDDQFGRPRPVVLDRKAHQYRESANDLVLVMQHIPDTSIRLASSLDKWTGTFARLCLTFHVIEIVDRRLREQTAPPVDTVPASITEQVGLYMKEILLPHLLRADHIMYSTAQTGHARWIANYILSKRLSRITARDIARDYRELRAPEARDTLIATMESLVTMGWVEEEAASSGRSVSAWKVNPRVHVVFEEHARREAERRRRERERIAAAVERVRAEQAGS